MTLKYHIFASNKDIAKAYANSPALSRGSRGTGVALLQGGLMDMGYKLSVSIAKNGAPDGIFGKETTGVVQNFQSDHSLKKDGIAGRNTIGTLDRLLVAKFSSPLPSVLKPKPRIAASRDYMIGSSDPSVSRDPGAGVWASKPVQTSYILDFACSHFEFYKFKNQ
ncbi:peptidoglycan-binding domain-containing protein [Desulfobacter curvatus]|uniref:peptidoglycan-binding domain-containing protein n=1 Tax=Desulfobacter curvatus TaxID=2290 RepID=UPI000370A72C|nr:peptidoglycan-binding domain-containing protein [Desulfobacter curvatus]